MQLRKSAHLSFASASPASAIHSHFLRMCSPVNGQQGQQPLGPLEVSMCFFTRASRSSLESQPIIATSCRSTHANAGVSCGWVIGAKRERWAGAGGGGPPRH